MDPRSALRAVEHERLLLDTLSERRAPERPGMRSVLRQMLGRR